MMTRTALDHVRADLAWQHRDYGTDGDRATPSRGRRLRGTTKAAALDGFSITGMTTTHANLKRWATSASANQELSTGKRSCFQSASGRNYRRGHDCGDHGRRCVAGP